MSVCFCVFANFHFHVLVHQPSMHSNVQCSPQTYLGLSVLRAHLWLPLPTTMCIPTHVSMWGTSMSASLGVHGQICVCVWGCLSPAMCPCPSQLSSVSLFPSCSGSRTHFLMSWERAGGLIEKGLNETSIPPPSHKTSKAGHGDSGTKLWISDSICSLCSLGLAPAGLLSPRGLEPGSPRCPEGMSTQPLVSPHCPVLGASEMKSIRVLLPNLSRVSPIPLRSEATSHLFSDSPSDINVFGG